MPQKTRSTKAKSKSAARATSEKYQKALESLDRAVKALHKGDAAKAKEQLEKLQDTHPEEQELMDRVRTYLLMCERVLAPQKRPKTAEEFVNAGILSLNENDPQQAIKHLSKALEMEPKNPHVLYCLAAAHAVSGDASTAAKHLKQAIQTDPSIRLSARTDQDFARVRDNAEVASLLAGA